jgi:hypothetical protein
VSGVSRGIDRIEVVFDDPNLVANAGLLVPATLMARLGLEALINATVRLVGRVGGASPGRKVLTLVAAILAGASHIDHANVLRAGATQAVLPLGVMAPSTLGTFLRAFTFGHVRQLDRVIAETIGQAWALGAGPGAEPLVIDMDSTICEVHGHRKQGAAYGYTRKLGYHPILATRAETGEVLHARLRKGSSQRGTKRFVEELIARVRHAGAIGAVCMRADGGFWSHELIDTLRRLNVGWSITVRINKTIRAAMTDIDEDAWRAIVYPDGGEAAVADTTYVTGKGRKQRSYRLVDAMGIAHMLGLADTELARLGVEMPMLSDERLALLSYDETDPETFTAEVLRDRPALVRFADHQVRADPTGCATTAVAAVERHTSSLVVHFDVDAVDSRELPLPTTPTTAPASPSTPPARPWPPSAPPPPWPPSC